ncbi:S24 family peptidase [Achromobacter spanius]|uniref:XRE family transcriptional regulator n=1 Tax=Achromobacter spanius TaxID=217203 RepID=UPI003208AD6C
MEHIAARLKAARSHRGISQAALAKMVGCGQSSIASIENGRNHSSALLLPIAVALRVNPVWLMAGTGEMLDPIVAGDKSVFEQSFDPSDEGLIQKAAARQEAGMIRLWDREEDLEPDENRVWVDRWDYQVCAGDGLIQWEIRQKQALPFTMDFFRAIGSKAKDCRLLMVRGDSMEPFLFNRDMVMVDVTKTTVRDGVVYAVAFEHEGLVKQIFKQTGGGLILHSYNPRYPDRVVEAEELDRLIIIGEIKYRSGSGFTSD